MRARALTQRDEIEYLRVVINAGDQSGVFPFCLECWLPTNAAVHHTFGIHNAGQTGDAMHRVFVKGAAETS